MTHPFLSRVAIAATACLFTLVSALPASALSITLTGDQKLPWEQEQVMPAPVAVPPAPLGRATALRDNVEAEWISVEPASPLTKGAKIARGTGPFALAASS